MPKNAVRALDPAALIARQRAYFTSGATRELEFRRGQLLSLRQAIADRESQICDALAADLGKPAFEAVVSEIVFCCQEIDYARKHLRQWVRPEKVGLARTVWPARGQIRSEPLGVVLIIAPWNYPLQLAIAPLVAAIAAGNCAIVKPSELTPHTSRVLAELIAAAFAPEYVSVVEGDKTVAQQLLAERFDHILFTGGSRVGKVVMAAAAEHLTPVTLELGGKSPCLVDRDADIETGAQRIAFGKFFNAGQTCVAPDYLLVDRAIKDDLLAALRRAIAKFYGDNPATSPDYARIVSDGHFQRLSALLDRDAIAIGGQSDSTTRYIAPTVLDGVAWDDPIMEDEIFGPLLPVLTYTDLDAAIAAIAARPAPLALYVFSRRHDVQTRVLEGTTSGGVCINDTIVHIISSTLPFGGVGASGIGAYHGRTGFDTFSHRRSVVRKGFWPEIELRYPPYEGKLSLFRKLLG
nr:aldehyde dehydrogenase [Rubidibacter lacunae]